MDLRKTIADLHQEKARLDRVIASLEQLASVSATVAPVVSRRGRRFMGAQERQVVSERMRKYWAARRASRMERAAQTEHVQAIRSASAA